MIHHIFNCGITSKIWCTRGLNDGNLSLVFFLFVAKINGILKYYIPFVIKPSDFVKKKKTGYLLEINTNYHNKEDDHTSCNRNKQSQVMNILIRAKSRIWIRCCATDLIHWGQQSVAEIPLMTTLYRFGYQMGNKVPFTLL